MHSSPRLLAPHRWRWVVVLVVGGLLYWLVLGVMIGTGNPNLFPTVLLVGALVAPLAALAYANWSTEQPLADGRLLVWIALLSGILGVVLAGVLEFVTQHRREEWPMLTVGLIEESAKMVVPAVALAIGLFRGPATTPDALPAPRVADPRAGVVVGIGAGAGFAVLETMGYGFTTLLSSGSLAAVDATLLLRGLFAPACHLAWSGLLAASLWHAVAAGRVGAGIARVAAVFVGVVLLHAVWDSLNVWPVHLVLALVSLGLLVIRIRRSWASSDGTPIPA